jgi:hypothetical protein
MATALAVADRIVDRWLESGRATNREGQARLLFFA